MGHRIRDRQGKLALLAADWKFRPEARQILRWVSEEEAERLLSSGRAEALCDRETGELVAYRVLRQCERPRPRAQFHPYRMRELVPVPSSTAFSRSEINAIAGDRFSKGRSRTARMSEEQRRSRIAKGMREMDLVEAARVKLDVYRRVH